MARNSNPVVNHTAEFSSCYVEHSHYGCDFAFGGADPDAYRSYSDALVESAAETLNVLARNTEAPDPTPPDWEKGMGSALHGVRFLLNAAMALKARADEEEEARAK